MSTRNAVAISANSKASLVRLFIWHRHSHSYVSWLGCSDKLLEGGRREVDHFSFSGLQRHNCLSLRIPRKWAPVVDNYGYRPRYGIPLLIFRSVCHRYGLAKPDFLGSHRGGHFVGVNLSSARSLLSRQ